MGLDIFRYGSRAVRLLIQRCLILWLCLFSTVSFAAFSTDSGGPYTYPTAFLACKALLSGAHEEHTEITFHSATATESRYTCHARNSVDQYQGTVNVWEGADQCSSPWQHQPDPITGETPSSGECSCVNGWTDAGDGFQPRCIVDRDQDATECYENGQIYDPSLGYCVLDCPNGQLSGVCLQDTADNSDSCNRSSPDYKGSIEFGKEKQNICLSDTTCDGGSLGVVNKVQLCIPDEYGPPTCPSGGVLFMDDYGWVCESLNDQPDPEPQPEPSPNTDTDGDGQPDEYQRENDPDAVNKGLDEIGKNTDKTNSELDKANKQLDNLGKGISELNKGIDRGLGTANGHLEDIKEGLTAPDGGYVTGGFDLVPTFSESATEFKNAVMGTEVAQSLSGFTNLPTVTSCPVYTLPETPFTGQIVMNIHCQVFEDYRGVFSVLFMFFWTGTALFLFFRA